MIPDNKQEIENRIISLGKLVQEGSPLDKQAMKQEALKILQEIGKLIKSNKELRKS